MDFGSYRDRDSFDSHVPWDTAIYFDDVTFVQGESALQGGHPTLLNAGFELPDLQPPDNQAPGAESSRVLVPYDCAA